MANRSRPGIDQDSIFALLEHADEQGHVQGPVNPETSRPAAQTAAKAKPNSAVKKPAQVKQAPKSTGQPGGQTARAEDYYRAFEHVYRDPGVNEVVLRFHKTRIVRIRPNGDFMLTSGGWHTATTVAALNDALHALGMSLTYQPPVSAGMWTLTDDSGAQYQFKDNMVIKATKAQHKSRGEQLLKAYNGGAEVPRYARKPPGAAATASRAQQAAQARPAAAGTPQVQGHATQQQQQHHHAANPRPAAADALQQLKAAMDELDIDQDELISDDHLCVVCLERVRDEVLVPCGHLVLCSVCCSDIVSKSNECPMCREKIEDHCTIDPNDS